MTKPAECPECVYCEGSGMIEDAPSFENSYGEHGLNPQECPHCSPAPKCEPDHPCRDTCSGWKQGYERGVSEASEAKHKLSVANECGLAFKADRDAAIALAEKYRTALLLIEANKNQTIYHYSEEFMEGANCAFGQSAEIAREALK